VPGLVNEGIGAETLSRGLSAIGEGLGRSETVFWGDSTGTSFFWGIGAGFGFSITASGLGASTGGCSTGSGFGYSGATVGYGFGGSSASTGSGVTKLWATGDFFFIFSASRLLSSMAMANSGSMSGSAYTGGWAVGVSPEAFDSSYKLA